MVDEVFHAQGRQVGKIEVQTPIIAPSFSSRGFPQISELWRYLQYKLYGICLISSFDVSEGSIPKDIMDVINVVIFDSGLYETNSQIIDYTGRHAPVAPVSWTRIQYHKTVSSLGDIGNMILVNFDHSNSIEKQIESASEDFSHVWNAASDFLVKPESQSELVNLARLSKYSLSLSQFNIIGVTARESGDSFLKRCSSIVMLRDLMNNAGLNLPIHVFGAITPLEVLTYFFCGADIFDGLNWLRLGFRDHASIPIEEAVVENMKWNLTDFDLLDGEWTHNLQFLYQLQEALRLYTISGDLGSLSVDFPIACKAVYIAEIAGAKIRK